MQFVEETDQIIVEHINKADKQAYEALFLRYREMLFAIAYHKTGNTQDALDIVQELFIHIWESRETLEISGNVAAYLTTSIKKPCYQLVLRHQQQLSISEISSALNLRPQSIRSQLSETSDRVRKLLEKHLLLCITLCLGVDSWIV